PKEQLHAGHHWFERRSDSRKFRRVYIDVNYWKTYVHAAFDLMPSEKGSISLWGRNGERHRMFSEHITAEKVLLVEAHGRKVYEWQTLPGRYDNHLLDCMVGCAVGASVCGIRTEHEKKKEKGFSGWQ
ncbi:MAG: phage terminase large subunit family protein, partial [Planctomycetaceae bacterium]|nr:phage terminase large subunit family protein [Planctomycetaceae bacterium]